MSNIDFLIVGLGNPEPERKHTRHNIGYLVADSFYSNHAITPFAELDNAQIMMTQVSDKMVAIIKPITGMNSVGEAVSLWIRKLNLSIYPADKVLVIVAGENFCNEK